MVLEIHTSDRANFRRCRRKWNWVSPLRGHLVQQDSAAASPLWMGTGFHFALEDYHGRHLFEHPTEAFMAYVDAHRQSQLPSDYMELTELSCSMLSYYTDVWLPRRESFKTITIDNMPGVEVSWKIPLPIDHPSGPVMYVGTFDRVVEDSEGRIWVVDYKTSARLESSNLETDGQVSAYSWAARKIFGERVEGVIWLQFLKKSAKGPAPLKTGGFSQNKAAKVPYGLYHAALMEEFGEIPAQYVEHLNYLAEQETEDGDDFIQMRRIRRSPQSSAATERHILAEVTEMIDPLIELYPNPTRDCSWDCPLRAACITLDDGYDWAAIIQENFMRRPEDPPWRERIKWPNGDPN